MWLIAFQLEKFIVYVFGLDSPDQFVNLDMHSLISTQDVAVSDFHK